MLRTDRSDSTVEGETSPSSSRSSRSSAGNACGGFPSQLTAHVPAHSLVSSSSSHSTINTLDPSFPFPCSNSKRARAEGVDSEGLCTSSGLDGGLIWVRKAASGPGDGGRAMCAAGDRLTAAKRRDEAVACRKEDKVWVGGTMYAGEG